MQTHDVPRGVGRADRIPADAEEQGAGRVGYTDTGTQGGAHAFRRVRIGTPEGRAELAALTGAAGAHVPELCDVGTTPNGDLVLVLPDCAVRLTDLLLRPGGLLPGEAVTVLVPLVDTLARAHAAGVAHGAVGAAAVRFTDDGSPVLHDWSTATVADLHGPAAFAAAAERDLAGAAALAGRLVDASLESALRTLPAAAAIEALFAVAVPVPVRLEPDAAPAPHATPGRVVGVASPTADPADRYASRAAAARSRLRGVRALAGSVRPRVWVTAGCSMALLVAALILLPGHGADAADAPTPRSPAASTAGAGGASAAMKASKAAEIAPRSLPATSAVAVLLAARARCTTTACLRGVDAAGSPVLTADGAALARHARPAGPATGRVRQVSTVGAAVVLQVGDRARPATVLVLREPAGWRLRDVVVPAAAP